MTGPSFPGDQALATVCRTSFKQKCMQRWRLKGLRRVPGIVLPMYSRSASQKNNAEAPVNVVTVLSDSNKKYLSTDLMKDEPVRENYISPEAELPGYEGIHRV